MGQEGHKVHGLVDGDPSLIGFFKHNGYYRHIDAEAKLVEDLLKKIENGSIDISGKTIQFETYKPMCMHCKRLVEKLAVEHNATLIIKGGKIF